MPDGLSASRSAALAAALRGLLALSVDSRRHLGLAGRRRVVERFALADTVRRYTDLYDDVAQCAA